MDTNTVSIKKQQRKKLPDFVRGGAYNKKRLDKIWRKPRGTSSKKRERLHGNVVVDAGYGTVKELRGKHFSGLEIVNVSSVAEAKNLNPKKQGAVVSGKIGLKRRMAVLSELITHKVIVLNIPQPEKYLKAKQEMLESSKQVKEETKEKKAEKKEKAKEESIEDKLSDEEKKKLEKKEIDRLLTKKF